MAALPCPACASVATGVIPKMTPDPKVTYYRCDLCGHVWVTFADGDIHHVTPLPVEDLERAG